MSHILYFIFRVYVEQSSDGRGLDLMFRSLDKSDEGEYACTATLDGRKEHKNVSLGIIGMNSSKSCLIYKRFSYYVQRLFCVLINK